MKSTVLALISAAAVLPGCAVCERLEPNTIRPEVQHISHIGQHFGGNQTHFGAELVGVTAEWKYKHVFVDLGEHYNISPGGFRQQHTVHPDGSWSDDYSNSCAGGLCGPRETTTITIGYEFKLK